MLSKDDFTIYELRESDLMRVRVRRTTIVIDEAIIDVPCRGRLTEDCLCEAEMAARNGDCVFEHIETITEFESGR